MLHYLANQRVGEPSGTNVAQCPLPDSLRAKIEFFERRWSDRSRERRTVYRRKAWPGDDRPRIYAARVSPLADQVRTDELEIIWTRLPTPIAASPRCCRAFRPCRAIGRTARRGAAEPADVPACCARAARLRSGSGADYRNRLPEDELIYFLLPTVRNVRHRHDRGGCRAIADDRLRSTHKAISTAATSRGCCAGRLSPGMGITPVWVRRLQEQAGAGSAGQESAGYHGYWVTDFTSRPAFRYQCRLQGAGRCGACPRPEVYMTSSPITPPT